LIIQQKKIINNKVLFICFQTTIYSLFSWDIDVNEDETLSTIDWDVLTGVDNQMEEALRRCQQNFIEYEEFFQNIIKEVSIIEVLFFSIVSFFLYFRFESDNMNIRKIRLFDHKFPHSQLV
jgi:hypothetical protein